MNPSTTPQPPTGDLYRASQFSREGAAAGTPLRDWLADDLNQHWIAWSSQHPHLAEAIDRVRLLDTAMLSLRQDAGFQSAMRRADLDEYRLGQAAEVLSLARGHLRHLLPL